MAYDLHGPWDSDVMTLGSIVRGQADIREIYNNTMPLVSNSFSTPSQGRVSLLTLHLLVVRRSQSSEA